MEECISKDAVLATANTLEKLQFLTSMAHVKYIELKYTIERNVLLGSRDTLKLAWKWYEGQPINISLWGPGKPGKLKCGSLLSKYDWCGWWWSDLPCTRNVGYICEVPLGEYIINQIRFSDKEFKAVK